MIGVAAYVAYLVAAAFVAHWVGRWMAFVAARLARVPAPVAPAPAPVAPPPAPAFVPPPSPVYVFEWWNGCRMEMGPGLHAANALLGICWSHPARESQ